MEKIDIDNLRTTLSLERFAVARYKEQFDSIPTLYNKMLIYGIQKNEEDHEREASAYMTNAGQSVDDIPPFKTPLSLQQVLEREGFKIKEGFKSTLESLYFDLYFEKNAVSLYGAFGEQAKDETIRKFFFDTRRSEMGHVAIFEDTINLIQSDQLDIEFSCPICGWFVRFGLEPQPGSREKCRRCGVTFELQLEKGDFKLGRVD